MSPTTVHDGSRALIDVTEGPLGDTRQEVEITAAHEKRFRTHPEVGLAALGVAPSTIAPLYLVEENLAVEDYPDEPALGIGWMRDTTLANGYPHRVDALFRDEPVLFIRH